MKDRRTWGRQEMTQKWYLQHYSKQLCIQTFNNVGVLVYETSNHKQKRVGGYAFHEFQYFFSILHGDARLLLDSNQK